VRGAAVGAVGATASSIGFPQPPQNLVAGSFSKPQAGQGQGNGAPHWPQKRLVPMFSVMQLGQRMWSPERRELAFLNHNRNAMLVEAEGESATPGRRADSRPWFGAGRSEGGALAEVLGVSAEDIAARKTVIQRAGSDQSERHIAGIARSEAPVSRRNGKVIVSFLRTGPWYVWPRGCGRVTVGDPPHAR